jgi:hypothetical protein
MAYLKPRTPLKDKNTGDYIYPLTTVDQVVMPDGSRLNSVFKHAVQKEVTLLASNWTAEAPYTQTITLDEYIDELSVDANVKYSGILNNDKILNKAASRITYIKKDGKNITFSCLENKPEIDIPVEIEHTCSNSIATVIDGIKPNFKIVKYETEEELLADVPEENTIGVITDTEITSWFFSATEPEAPEDGAVWFITSVKGYSTAFNILKENCIQVYPIYVKQHIGDAWVDKTAKIYQDGEWIVWWDGQLYDAGNEYVVFTGGITRWQALTTLTGIGTMTKNSKSITLSATNGSSIAVGTSEPLDLTPYKKLKVRITSSNAGNRITFGIFSSKSASKTIATGDIGAITAGEYSMDISSIDTEGYPALRLYSQGNTLTVSFDKLWLER